jgi:hypothetical protein
MENFGLGIPEKMYVRVYTKDHERQSITNGAKNKHQVEIKIKSSRGKRGKV